MAQFLPRGFELPDGNRITKVISEGDEWQIYHTVCGNAVLAAHKNLYTKWVHDYLLPENLFRETSDSECRYFESSDDYLISSVAKGPYPKSEGQIQAFSIAFRLSVEKFPDADFSESIYIEEYSLILPTSFGKNPPDNRLIYGKWITGGIGISIDAMDQVSRIMTWLPKERLLNAAGLAGFEISEKNIPNLPGCQISENKNSTEQLFSYRDHLPSEKFSLPGRINLENFFNEHIVDIVLHREQYERMGIPFPGATLLYGPPGCGKTFAVEKLSEYLGWPQFVIDSGTIGSPYIHDTSKKISGLFRAAMDAAPSIIIIDEMEAFLSDRSASGTANSHHIEEVAEFLRKIPEASAKKVLVFAMTNMIDAIDPAIMRRGRFDHIIEVKMASAEEISQMLETKFRELPIDESVKLKEIAEKLQGRPLSDVSFVLREAGKSAVRKNIEQIDQDCFIEAIAKLPKTKEQSGFGFLNL